jgi:hypothetical protein
MGRSRVGRNKRAPSFTVQPVTTATFILAAVTFLLVVVTFALALANAGLVAASFWNPARPTGGLRDV